MSINVTENMIDLRTFYCDNYWGSLEKVINNYKSNLTKQQKIILKNTQKGLSAHAIKKKYGFKGNIIWEKEKMYDQLEKLLHNI